NGIASDATAYKNQPTQSGPALIPASLIAGGARFDGTNAIKLADSPTTRVLPNQGITISAWIKFDAPQQDAYLVSAQDTAGRALVLGLNGTSAYVRLAGGSGSPSLTSPELTTGDWHHVALRAGDGRLNLFIDGEDVASMDADIPEIAAPLVIGQ